jgi:hypothetical protein
VAKFLQLLISSSASQSVSALQSTMEAQVKRTKSEDGPDDCVCVEILTAAVHNRDAPEDEEDEQEDQVVTEERKKYWVPSEWVSGIPLSQRAFIFRVERDLTSDGSMISFDAHASSVQHLPDGQEKLVRHLLDVKWGEEYICDAAWEEIGKVTLDSAMRTPEFGKDLDAERKKNSNGTAYSRTKAKCLQTEVEKAKEKLRKDEDAFGRFYVHHDDRVFSRFRCAKGVKRAAADTIADYSIFVVFLEWPY